MTRLRYRALVCGLAMLVLLVPASAVAGSTEPLKVEIGEGGAVVTLLEGAAWRLKPDAATEEALSEGGRLASGDRIRTGQKTRIEVRLPDESFLRFDEETTFVLVASRIDAAAKSRKITIRMIFGKTWARVSKLFSSAGRFDIQTQTAVAGVRGTVYRMNVEQDSSAVVKVYDGEIEVRRRLPEDEAAAPGVMQEPTPIPGPHPVTMEEWVTIVRSLEQINIAADGTPTKPFRFDIQEDLNDWVRWNQSRDRLIEKDLMREEFLEKKGIREAEPAE